MSQEARSGEQTLDASADSETSEDESSHLGSPTDLKSPSASASLTKSSSVAEDVIGKQGQYGRFAERWFSKKGWSTEKRRNQGMSTDSLGKPEKETVPSDETDVESQGKHAAGTTNSNNDESSDQANVEVDRSVPGEHLTSPATENIASTLLPKLLKTTEVLLASRSFFFSYDYDITRRMGNHETKSKDIPLHRSVEPIVGLPFRFFLRSYVRLIYHIVLLES